MLVDTAERSISSGITTSHKNVAGDPSEFAAALNGDGEQNQPADRTAFDMQQAAAAPATEWISLDTISPNPFQPRRTFNEQELQDLEDSIAVQGQLQPILVRPLFNEDHDPFADEGPRSYQLIVGERRYRAMQRLRFKTNKPVRVLCIVRRCSDVEALEIALEENAKRADINAMDEAAGFAQLERMGRTQEQIGARFGIGQSAVSNCIRLLELPEQVQTFIAEGQISKAHGIALCSLNGAPGITTQEINELALKAVAGRWNSKELEVEVQAFKTERDNELNPSLPIAEDEAEESESTSEDETAAAEPASESTPAEPEKAADTAPEPTAEKSTKLPEAKEPKAALKSLRDKKPKAEQFKLHDKVQWDAGKNKWLSGEVVEVGRALVFVMPTGAAKPEQRKSFQKKNCPLKPWDGTSKPGPAAPAEPVKTAKEVAAAKATSTPAASTPAATPAPRKAPDGFTPTFAPTDYLFECEDAGLSVKDVFEAARRLIVLAQRRSISVDDYLMALEAE